MKKKLNVALIICVVTYLLFVASRAAAVLERGNQAFGGEIFILLAPLIAWIIYHNIKATKEEYNDYKLSNEAENLDYIQNLDHSSSILITDINEIMI